MKNEITIAFTGHRPDKLGGYEAFEHMYGKMLYDFLVDFLMEFAENNAFDRLTVITGGAQGVDQVAFWAAENIRRRGVPVHNVLAIPHAGQETPWPDTSQKKYRTMLERADEVVMVESVPGYEAPENPKSEKQRVSIMLQTRNEYMVDNCDLLIAVWNGTNGGTGNCVRYAEYNQKQIHFMDPRDILGI